jgi:hypothetical protein
MGGNDSSLVEVTKCRNRVAIALGIADPEQVENSYFGGAR